MDKAEQILKDDALRATCGRPGGQPSCRKKTLKNRVEQQDQPRPPVARVKSVLGKAGNKTAVEKDTGKSIGSLFSS